MEAKPEKTRIIIMGGGFAGAKCAKTLSKKLDLQSYEIVLFNKENHMVFHPLLAEVVGSSLDPDPVTTPLRQLLPEVNCRTEEVHSIDLDKNTLLYENNYGNYDQINYDYIVICCGSAVNMSIVPGMQDHAYPIKTVGDAIALRVHVIEQMEKAEVEDNPETKKNLLSFIIVGGGFSGIEVAGEINDLVRDSVRFYKNIREEDVKVTVVHGGEQILPEVSPSLRDFAQEKMEKAGLNFILNTRAKFVTSRGVGYGENEIVEGNTVVGAVGNTMPSVIERLDVEKERGRIANEPDMRIKGYSNAWAIGDCSYTINHHDNKPSPPTGQFAERQGRQTADNIIRVINGKDTLPFSFNPFGLLCSIGGNNAVAEIKGIRISGFLAWFMWRGVYLFKLPKFSKKVKVGLDWAWDIFFARDLAHTKIHQTDRVAMAHYEAGDYIFKQGEPSNNFYIVEQGEVEVLRLNESTGEEELVALLGENDFFGEMSLLQGTNHTASVRARTNIEVLVMGKHIFEQTRSIRPFRNLVEDTIKRRSVSIWQKIPLARDILDEKKASEIMDPVNNIVDGNKSFEEILDIFNDTSIEFFCVSDNGKLSGVITRSDLFRAFESGASKSTTIKECMRTNPITVAGDETALVAASAIKDNNIKRIFVVDNHSDNNLVGYIRAEKLLYLTMKSL